MANVMGYNRKLAALMRKHGLVDEQALQALYDKCAKESLLLASHLVSEGMIDEPTLLGLVAEDANTPPLDLDKMKIDIEQIREMNKGVDIVTEEQSKFYGVLPLALIGDHLTLAVANPYDVVMVDNLKLAVKKQIMPVVSTERAINKARELTYHAQEKAVADMMENMGDEGDELAVTDAKRDEDDKKDDLAVADGDESPAVKLVRTVIATAIQKGASDIHIEPFEKRVRIRFRMDGEIGRAHV